MDIVYSAYLANLGVNFSVWANNIPDGIQTGILMIFLLYFEYRDEQEGRDNFGHVLGNRVKLGDSVQPRAFRRSSTLEEALEYGSIN